MAEQAPSWSTEAKSAPSWSAEATGKPVTKKAAAEPEPAPPSPSGSPEEARAAAPVKRTDAYGPIEGVYKYPRDEYLEGVREMEESASEFGKTADPWTNLKAAGGAVMGGVNAVMGIPGGVAAATYGSAVEAANRKAGGEYPDRQEVAKRAGDAILMVPGGVKAATNVPKIWKEYKATKAMTAGGVAKSGTGERIEPPLGSVPEELAKGFTGNIPTDTAWRMKWEDRTKKPSSTDLKSLAADIKKNGIKEPIEITFNRQSGLAYISDGNNRLASARSLGMKDIPYRLVETNIDLSAAEKGRAIPLKDFGVDAGSIPLKVKSPEASEVEAWLNEQTGHVEPGMGKPRIIGPPAGMRERTIEEAAADLEQYLIGNKRPYRVDQYADEMEGNVKSQFQDVESIMYAGRKLVPPGDHMHIIDAIQRGPGEVAKLTDNERAAAIQFMRTLKNIGDSSKEAGVIPQLKKNFAPQMWDMSDPLTKQLFEESVQSSSAEARSTAFTVHALKSSVPSYAEGIRMGMKPKSTDMWKILGDYAKSVIPAAEQKKMIEAVKMHVAPNGQKVMYGPSEKMPEALRRDYVKTTYPDLEGYRVHREILPSLRAMLDSGDVDSVTKALQAVSFTAKRMETGWSFFHPMSLYQAWVGTGGNPFKVRGAVRGAMEAYASNDPTIKIGLRNGLEVKAPLETTGGAETVSAVRQKLDDLASKVPGVGSVVKGATKGLAAVDDKFQQFTWDYMHTGLKMETFSRKFASAMEKNAKLSKPRSEEEVARDVSSFVNSTFGGLNWRQMAETFDNPKFRDWAMHLATKQGQAVAQIGMFAPDWKVSTVSSWTRAVLPTSVTGASPELAAMHREYLVRSALITAAISDGVNYAATGHHVWENKAKPTRDEHGRKVQPTWQDEMDAKTRIELDDGTHVQGFKHFMEGPHLAMNPGKWIINAMGAVPSEVMDQATGREYVTPYPGYSPPMKSRLAHLAKRFLPFSASQVMGGGIDAGDPTFMQRFGGFLGAPTYGLTDDQKQAIKSNRKSKGIEIAE